MVAYSFKTYFAPQIEDGSKRHTIRGPSPPACACR
jgi:hypothetical protein